MKHSSNDGDHDVDLEMEGDRVRVLIWARPPNKATVVPADESRYRAACKFFGVAPASSYLRDMHTSELDMMHCGLGAQPIRALVVSLVTNISMLKLNLKMNQFEGLGVVAIAEMLKENCYITVINLSENRLGVGGAQAISSMLMENSTLVHLNHFNDPQDQSQGGGSGPELQQNGGCGRHGSGSLP
ncbi:hypothetical protein AAFF_G00423130 [Aldrovandia affinis]|uniref:Uncharacterized protein n=1 Tax=Aldrovandia affinis TaxID=143900 RepID=A0AAD7X051_9TELE|nr:hypothetical protein AAFF_G00423130 [Aldrovandia affinis]